MKKLSVLSIMVGGALLAAVPLSPQWSSEKNNLVLSLDRADARIERPLTPGSIAGVNRRVHRRAYRGAYYGAAAAGAAAAYGVGSYTGPTAIRLMALATDIRLMALGPTTGRAFAPPAEWRSIAPADTEARA